MRLTRCSNAFDCHDNLKKELAKDESNSSKWDHYIQTRSPKIIKKPTWSKDQTHVCLGLEPITEYNQLSSTHSNILYIDHSTIYTIPPIQETQELFQIFPNITTNDFII